MLNNDDTPSVLGTVILAAVIRKSRNAVPPIRRKFLTHVSVEHGAADWAALYHMVIPETQATDSAFLNSWLPELLCSLPFCPQEEGRAHSMHRP